jgi:hypothetical protein
MKEKDLIDKYVAMLPSDRVVSTVEAERRAGAFLEALAHVNTFRHMYSNQKIGLLSAERATYASVMAMMGGSKITEKKIEVEAAPVYMKAREELEAIENDLSYLRAFHEIFTNAHVFYRQLAKGEIL